MLCCNRGCISSRFRDNGPQTFWGHDLDLSRSRDVIDHVTNRFPIGHFLVVLPWYQVVSKRFRDIRPQKPVRAHTDTQTDTHTSQVILYSVSHAMYCIGQTTTSITSATWSDNVKNNSIGLITTMLSSRLL